MADLDPAGQAVTVASVREEDGTPVVYLSGELDLTSAAQFSTAIDAALASHPGRLVLDASGLTFMDSSGIRPAGGRGCSPRRAGCDRGDGRRTRDERGPARAHRLRSDHRPDRCHPASQGDRLRRRPPGAPGVSDAAAAEPARPRAADRGRPRRRLGRHSVTARSRQEHLVPDRHAARHARAHGRHRGSQPGSGAVIIPAAGPCRNHRAPEGDAQDRYLHAG